VPSLFQLIPHATSAKFYDENLKPFKIDIYDVKTWKKYGWALTADTAFMDTLGKSKKAQAEKYFETVLLRAKRFHEALDAKTKIPAGVTFYAFGSDCKNTLDGAVIYFDTENGKWATLMEGDSFRKVNGEKIPVKLVRQTLFSKGDGSVTKSSLFAETVSQINGQNLFGIEPLSPMEKIVCDDHTTITSNKFLLETFSSIMALNAAK
jgi:hypothetical protein